MALLCDHSLDVEDVLAAAGRLQTALLDVAGVLHTCCTCVMVSTHVQHHHRPWTSFMFVLRCRSLTFLSSSLTADLNGYDHLTKRREKPENR